MNNKKLSKRNIQKTKEAIQKLFTEFGTDDIFEDFYVVISNCDADENDLEIALTNLVRDIKDINENERDEDFLNGAEKRKHIHPIILVFLSLLPISCIISFVLLAMGYQSIYIDLAFCLSIMAMGFSALFISI